MSKTIDGIEVADEWLEKAMRLSNTHEPKAAIIEALREYVRPRSQREIIQFLGTSDGFMTHEELMRDRETDS
jgi:Arc/MetJ family transcription regulator